MENLGGEENLTKKRVEEHHKKAAEKQNIREESIKLKQSSIHN